MKKKDRPVASRSTSTHDAWQVRESARARRRRAELFSGTIPTPEPYDPEPSARPIAPPTITATFPAQLRAFASISRTGNDSLAAECVSVRNAWSGFNASCSWVRLGSTTFLQGFQNMLFENQADAVWVETIAAAFEHAGGGSLSDADITLAWAARVDPVGTKESLEKLTESERESLTLLGWVAQSFIDQVIPPGDDPLGLVPWATDRLATLGGGLSDGLKDLRYGRLAPRVQGRFVALAATRLGRGLQALDPGNWVAKPNAATLRAGWSTASKWVGRAGPVLSGVTAGVEQWVADENADYEMDERVARAGTRAVTVGLGAWGGAALGAKAGLVAGSFFGPAGTVIGGIAGGIIGGVIGSGLGNWAADQVVDAFGDVGDKLGDGLSNLGDALTFWD